MKRAGLLAAVLLASSVGFPVPAFAQLSDSETFIEAQVRDPNDARQTRRLLQQLLLEHPPAVRVVLQADPSLLNRKDYLAPYPRLAAFLEQHPEVARDPAFFFGVGPGYSVIRTPDDRTPQERALGVLENVLVGTAFFIVAMTVLLVLGALIKQAIEHRRWVRQSRVQTEIHTKILDRLQSNEDLLAYIQTPAGRRFLEAGPSPQDAAPPHVGAPFARMLWSVQAGVVLASLGVGLWIVQRSVMDEAAAIFHALGVIALMLGLGAILSAAASYVLSARFGLLGSPRS